MMDAVFVFDRKAPLIVGLRFESALDIGTDFHVFLLDFIAKGNRLLHAFPANPAARLLEIPFKDGQRLLVIDGQDDVDRHLVGIDVEHSIGKDPIIERVLLAI